MNKKIILGFKGEHRFLSNFWEVKIYLEGETEPYLSVENAYQASKTTDLKLRELIKKYSPGEAKTLGKNMIIRHDWNDELRIKTMRELLLQKFDSRDAELVQKLLYTGDSKLIEENNWGDTFFGVCDGKGTNHLGKLLMDVRSALSSEKNVIHNFLVNKIRPKTIAEYLNISERTLYRKKQAYDLLHITPHISN